MSYVDFTEDKGMVTPYCVVPKSIPADTCAFSILERFLALYYGYLGAILMSKPNSKCRSYFLINVEFLINSLWKVYNWHVYENLRRF